MVGFLLMDRNIMKRIGMDYLLESFQEDFMVRMCKGERYVVCVCVMSTRNLLIYI